MMDREKLRELIKGVAPSYLVALYLVLVLALGMLVSSLLLYPQELRIAELNRQLQADLMAGGIRNAVVKVGAAGQQIQRGIVTGLLQLESVQIHIVTRIARRERHIQLMNAGRTRCVRRNLPIGIPPTRIPNSEIAQRIAKEKTTQVRGDLKLNLGVRYQGI